MDKYSAVGANEIFDYFEERGSVKLAGFSQLKKDLMKSGASDKDIVCAKRMAMCLVGLIEDIFPQDMDLYLSFYQKRTDSSQCLGIITNKDKDGFGFYTAGICEAVKSKTEEAAFHGAVMSEKTRMLAMVARTARSLMLKRKMIEPFLSSDFAYEKDDDLRSILWGLNVISYKTENQLKAQNKFERFTAEIDGMAIELLVAKKLNEGVSADVVIELIKRSAPERVPGTKQPFVLFF
jgi:hypothetical protein